jgi:ABC-type bacteriocin/lantibiotic exporter with double-glycine peptidase domain
LNECWRIGKHLNPACGGSDVPLLDTPNIRQRSAHDCGAAAFAILYRFHFSAKPLPDWGELADPARGLSPDALELFVRKEFRNHTVGKIDLAHLQLLARFTPVLCCITTPGGDGHWTACRGVTRTRVHTQDPDAGRVSYTHAEWTAAWTDATTTTVFERFALAGWR